MRGTCSEDGCSGLIKAKGLCNKCYQRIRKQGGLGTIVTAYRSRDPIPSLDELTYEGGWVYFLECDAGSERFIKIGATSQGMMRQRIRVIQTGNPFPLQLLAVVPGATPEERFLHHRFRDLRVRGEWFRVSYELRQLVNDLQDMGVREGWLYRKEVM